MNNHRIFTIPNFFSLIRIFLVIPIYYYISIDKNIIALVYVVLAFVSDGLDGYLARRLNQVSDVGKILDPLADKICTSGGFIALSIFQGLPFWITTAIIARDIIIILGSILLIERKKVVTPSNYLGKITVTIISFFAISILLKLDVLYQPLLISVIILLSLSLFYYAIIFIKNLKNDAHA
jgi:CDP-diacylglycerol--glycerol-3-phosphate 3-phosphatidyltransferase